MPSVRPVCGTIGLAVLALGCGGGGAAGPDPAIFGALGDPLPTLTAAQRSAFERGRDLAERRFTPESGLGPEFNATFCAGCHEKPVVGGSAGHYRDFLLAGALLLDDSTFPRGKNGVQRQYSWSLGRDPSDTETNVVAPRNPIPFFGAGLLLEVADEEILSRADPDDLDGDGISGRANIVNGFVGRFGRKAQTVDLEIFIRGPLFNHMGVTTRPLSASQRAELPMVLGGGLLPALPKQSVLPDAETIDDDGVPDPELSPDELFDLVSYSMTLAAPTPGPRDEAARRGAERFEEAACSSCHAPALEGPRGAIPVYSDLLLHDMGEDLADRFTMGEATGVEFRTQPLWGVIAVAPYLHDGRAGTIDEAIRWHGGEAEASAAAYAAMSDDDRRDLLAFLGSLGGADQASEGLVPPRSPIPEPGTYGGPLGLLDEQARVRFEQGRAAFDRDVSFSEGVGPAFNGDSCRGCHFLPTIGGAGPSGVDAMRQGIIGPDGTFSAPSAGTGIARHATFAMPERPEPDAASNFFEARQTPAVFGLGLIERIPRVTIEAMADPLDLDEDGIAGRPHVLPDGRLGRFGWKANVPTVREFVRDALSNELGLTLPSEEGATFGALDDVDDSPDPEVGVAMVDAIEDYLVLLGPPPRGEGSPALVSRGDALFVSVGCAKCHVPTLQTDDGVGVMLYSDLLLHDVSDGA
ncbi:MAG: di-heme oxidoredictase family protein, partial [Polyangiales bacterium]